jgi:uncharacterized small protein (DUF1192 family)
MWIRDIRELLDAKAAFEAYGFRVDVKDDGVILRHVNLVQPWFITSRQEFLDTARLYAGSDDENTEHGANGAHASTDGQHHSHHVPPPAKSQTPDDCIVRISTAMDEMVAIRDMMEATPKGKAYRADWETNRSVACDHLSDAWDSVSWALNAVARSQHHMTRDEQVEIEVETHLKHLATLSTEVERLKAALAAADARAAAAEALALEGERAQRVRRVVMSVVHPDKAADHAEGVWRTKLCQTLFPEIDRVMNGA